MAERASAVALSHIEAQVRFAVRMRPATAVALGTGAFQFDIPINTCVSSADRTIARLGPDEWLVLAPDRHGSSATPDGGSALAETTGLTSSAAADALAGTLETAPAGHFFSLVDISHRNVGFSVDGARAREVINSGCPLDLDDSVFPPGTATRTLLGKTEIVLLRPTSERSYRVECWRSFAPYVHEYLREAAREFAQPPTYLLSDVNGT